MSILPSQKENVLYVFVYIIKLRKQIMLSYTTNVEILLMYARI